MVTQVANLFEGMVTQVANLFESMVSNGRLFESMVSNGRLFESMIRQAANLFVGHLFKRSADLRSSRIRSLEIREDLRSAVLFIKSGTCLRAW